MFARASCQTAGVADRGVSGDTGSDSGSDSDGAIKACGLAMQLDECCHQPIPATAEAVLADDCLVPWPYDEAELPEGLQQACTELQPEICRIVDCDLSPRQ